jgi:hypothetical protein
VFITAMCVCFLLQDLVQSCLHGGGGYGRTCATRDDEPRPVWTRLPITHYWSPAGVLLLQAHCGARRARAGNNCIQGLLGCNLNAISNQTKLSHVNFFVLRARQILDRFHARRHALHFIFCNRDLVIFGRGRRPSLPLQLIGLLIDRQCCWNETAGAYWCAPG